MTPFRKGEREAFEKLASRLNGKMLIQSFPRDEITHQERVRAAVAKIERPTGALFHAPGRDRPHLRVLN